MKEMDTKLETQDNNYTSVKDVEVESNNIISNRKKKKQLKNDKKMNHFLKRIKNLEVFKKKERIEKRKKRLLYKKARRKNKFN